MFKWKKYDTRDILDDIYKNQELLNNKTDDLEFININVFDVIDENNIEEDVLYRFLKMCGNNIEALTLLLKTIGFKYFNINVLLNEKMKFRTIEIKTVTSDIIKRFKLK